MILLLLSLLLLLLVAEAIVVFQEGNDEVTAPSGRRAEQLWRLAAELSALKKGRSPHLQGEDPKTDACFLSPAWLNRWFPQCDLPVKLRMTKTRRLPTPCRDDRRFFEAVV